MTAVFLTAACSANSTPFEVFVTFELAPSATTRPDQLLVDWWDDQELVFSGRDVPVEPETDTRLATLLVATTATGNRRVEARGLRGSEVVVQGGTQVSVFDPGRTSVTVLLSMAGGQDASADGDWPETASPVLDGRSMDAPPSQPEPTDAAIESTTDVEPPTSGLTAEFYANDKLVPPIALTRVDPMIDFLWRESPGLGVPAHGFSVRWKGFIRPFFNEPYTLILDTDDGHRLWVDGTLVINAFADGPAKNMVTLPLVAGRNHAVRIEMVQYVGAAKAVFSWSSPSQTLEVIPQTRLSPR